MCDLYERIKMLCDQKGVTGSKMCTDIGISKNLMPELKSGRRKDMRASKASKIAAYFGVTTDYILTGVTDGANEVDKVGQELLDDERTVLQAYRSMSDEDKLVMQRFIKRIKNSGD